MFEIWRQLKKIRKELKSMSQQIDNFVVNVQKAFAQVNAALDNITQDEANLAKEIQTLQAQIATSTSSTLSVEDQAALDAVVKSAQDLVTKTQSTADAVPDLPPAPTA